MRFFRRIASVKFMTSCWRVVVRKSRALVCALVITTLMTLTTSESALANGLRIGVRIQGELYSPLVPVTQNFKTCISIDKNGVPIVSLCPADKPSAESIRKPAGEHQPKPPKPRY